MTVLRSISSGWVFRIQRVQLNRLSFFPSPQMAVQPAPQWQQSPTDKMILSTVQEFLSLDLHRYKFTDFLDWSSV